MNIQTLTRTDARVIWTSPGLPGVTHDLSAARSHGIVNAVNSTDLWILADKGYQGAGGRIWTPHKGRGLPKTHRQANRLHNGLRAPCERGHARLKTWHILRHYRGCPTHVGALVTAVLVLNTWR